MNSILDPQMYLDAALAFIDRAEHLTIAAEELEMAGYLSLSQSVAASAAFELEKGAELLRFADLLNGAM